MKQLKEGYDYVGAYLGWSTNLNHTRKVFNNKKIHYYFDRVVMNGRSTLQQLQHSQTLKRIGARRACTQFVTHCIVHL